ncbi:acyltransferase [uncultured Sunxiuqinia sp.]|uniref:acyltransferase n=1 Tax=uncultured Sunxiuqinia sp. TaxID=1573825 RepID=UPI0026276B42|nr:acyltransferase [uncultured Sunxiuqinia sp.]
MNPISLYFLSFFLKILPVSRCFRLKNVLLNKCGINISSTARIYSNIRIYGNGELTIGEDTFIGHEAMIICSNPSKVNIGSCVDIAPRVYIGTGSHEIEPESKHIAGKGVSKNIEIGDGTWIGANSSILPGVKIGKKVVIAAGSLVSNDIPSYTIAAGIPAEPIKEWNKEKEIWESI